MMTKVRLAGVPEQAFIPILLAIEQGIFTKLGLQVEWFPTPEGTGKLLTIVEEGEVDIALTVTDGFIAGKAAGRKVSLCGTYITSPLVWACSVSRTSSLESLEDLKPENLKHNTRWGVSRIGSGSHTMGVYASKNMATPSDELDFVVANDFRGLRDGANSDDFDAFLWEHFTSKPYWGKETKHIGDVSTPWPAFSFVSGKNLTEAKNITANDIEKLFAGIALGVELFIKGGDATVERICREHKHTTEDAQLWLSRVKYAVEGRSKPMAIDRSHYSESVTILKETGLVPTDYDVERLWGENLVAAFA